MRGWRSCPQAAAEAVSAGRALMPGLGHARGEEAATRPQQSAERKGRWRVVVEKEREE